jgi:hypothetical protein
MRGAGLVAALAALAWAPPGSAHIVYGQKTLSGLIAEADLVVHARVVGAGDGLRAPAVSGGESRPVVEVEVIEVLKGRSDAKRLRFAQHGHGVAPFEPGSENLVFLIDVARSRELAALDRPGGVDWVSLQEHQDRYPLPPDRRARLLAVARTYVQAETAATAEERIEARRQAGLSLLTSGDAQLAASALRDLVLVPSEPLVTEEDLPLLRPVLDDPTSSMGVRVGLLIELARRGLVDPEPVWSQLLADTVPPRDRITAIRAAGPSGSAAARARLLEILAGPDEQLAAEAAGALGAPGRPEVVAPLGAALSHESPRVRMGAIRGLGRVGSPEARAVLGQAARSHPDPATRRRAEAELRKAGTAPGGD